MPTPDDRPQHGQRIARLLRAPGLTVEITGTGLLILAALLVVLAILR